MTLLDQFISILAAQNPAPSRATVKNYKADVAKFLRWYDHKHGSFEPTHITPQTLESYRNYLLNETKSEDVATASQTRLEQRLSLRSVDRHISSLRKFFKFLVVSGHLTQSPFEAITQAANEKATDPYKLADFRNYLYVLNASDLTIKNYIMDVKQFFSWAEKVLHLEDLHEISQRNIFKHITAALVTEYKGRLHHEAGLSPVSINRKLSSLRRYLQFAQAEGLLAHPIHIQSAEALEKETTPSLPEFLRTNNIQVDQDSTDAPSVITKPQYSKIPPIRLFQRLGHITSLGFEAAVIAPLAAAAIKLHLFKWKATGGSVFVQTAAKATQTAVTSTSHVQRLVLHGGQTPGNFKKGFYAPHGIALASLPLHKKLIHHARYTRPHWYKKYHENPVVHYFHFAILVIIMTAIGAGMYQVWRSSESVKAAPSAPLRILSFQGRLTDASDNPITTPTALRFIIYNDDTSSGSARLWEEVRVVTPDTDGIFATLMGSDNAGGTAALCNGGSPPASPPDGPCGIPQSLFGDNPALWLGITVLTTSELTPRQQIATVPYATNSELLQGMPPITQAAAGTTNVVLALNSSGDLVIGGSENPVFQATGGSFTLQGTTTIISTTTGSGGNVTIAPDGLGKIDLQKPLINSTLNNNVAGAAGAVEINDALAVLGTTSASLVILEQQGSGPLLTASVSGSTKFTVLNSGQLSIPVYNTAGGVLYGTATGLISQTTAGTATQCLLGGTTPTWGFCGTGGYWDQTNGALYPANTTWDFLVGGNATSSANFAVLNNAAGIPVASVSGNFIVMPKLGGGGNVGLGTTTPGARLDVAGNVIISGTTGVTLSGSGADLAFTGGGTNTISSTGTLEIGAHTLTGAITGNNQNITGLNNLSAGGTITFSGLNGNNAVLYGTTSTGVVAQATTSTANLCLLSGAGAGYAPSWGACSTGGDSYWGMANGAVFPSNQANATVDFFIGGVSTASAKFAILNMNSGNPTASISGNLALAVPTAAGSTNTLDLLNGSSLNIRTSVGGAAGANSRLFIDKDGNGGNIGIGTTAPSTKLFIQTGAIGGANTGQYYLGSDAGKNLELHGSASSAYIDLADNIADDFDTRLISTTSNDFQIRVNGSSTPSMVILASGNLGIGTTAPVGNFHVSGTLNTQAAGIFDTTMSNDILTASASGVTRFVVKNGGNVGIGTNLPGALLHASGGNVLVDNTFGIQMKQASGTIRTVLTATSGDVLQLGSTAFPIYTMNDLGANTDGGADLGPASHRFRDLTLSRNLTAGGPTITFSTFTTNGGLLYTNGSGVLAQTNAGSTNDCLLGGTTPSFGFCPGAWWNQANGALYPINSTVDLLVGGQSSTSAKFAVIGVNTTTPAASLSGTLSIKASTATQQIQTFNLLNGSALNITTSVGGDAGANSRLFIDRDGNGGNIGIGTTLPGNKLSVYGANVAATSPSSIGNTRGTLQLASTTDNGSGANANLGGSIAFSGIVTTGNTGQQVFAEIGGRKENSTESNQRGYLAFSTIGTGTYEKMRIDSNGNVGIGSTVPTSKLFVSNVGMTATGKALVNLNQLESQDIFTASASGTTRFVIQNGGNVGIGTSLPSGLLNVFSSNTQTTIPQLRLEQASTGDVTMEYLLTGTRAWVTGIDNSDADKFKIAYANDGFTSTAMTWQTDGNVGIGITNPGFLLEVNGTARINGNTTIGDASGDSLTINAATLSLANASTLDLASSQTALNIESGLLNFDTSNSRIGIGTTAPLAKLDVNGTASASGDLILASAPGTTRAIQSTQNNTLTIGGNMTGNIVLNPINGGGDVRINGTTTLNGQTYTWPSGGQSSGYALVTDGSGTLSWSPTSGFGTNYWDLNLGKINPKFETIDLLIGGTATAAAKFAVLNMNPGAADQPVASISSGLNGYGSYLTADGTLGTTRRQSLLIGNSSSYNTTGNVLIHPNGTGNVGIGSSVATSKLYVSGQTYSTSGFGLNNGTAIEVDSNTGYTVSTTNSIARAAGNFYIGIDTNNDSTSNIFVIQTNSATAGSGTELLRVTEAGNLGLGTTSPQQKLDIAGSATISATLSLGPLLQADAGTCSQSAAGKMYYDADQNSYYFCNGTIWTQMGSGAGGGNDWFTMSNGLLYPINSTLDFTIGGQSTNSAKFAVLNMVGSGAPTASISSGLNGNGMFMTADGTLSTTRRQSLVIGNSSSYNTTGNVLINPNGTGNVGIGLYNPGAPFHVSAATTNLATFTSTSAQAPTLQIVGTDRSVTIGAQVNTLYALGGFRAQANTTGAHLTFTNAAASTTYGSLAVNSNEDMVLTQSQSGKYILLSGGSVGINTTTPLATLHVTGNSATIPAASVSARTNMAGLIIDNTIGDLLTASSSGLSRFVIKQDGNVGVGTTAPSAKLDVAGNIYNSAVVSNDSGIYGLATGTHIFSFTRQTNDLSIAAFSGIGFDTNQTTTNPDASYAMYLTAAGNLGIGTTLPTALLDVAGAASVSGQFKLYGTPQIQSTANQTLTLGGDTTGNIVLSPLAGGGDVRINGTTTLNGQTYTWPSGGQSGGYALTTNGGGVLSWTAVAGASTVYWNLVDGGLFPAVNANATTDLFIGGISTASAKFAFINMNIGNPTASISGNLALAVPTTAGANTLDLLNNSTLNIRTSVGGNGGATTALFIDKRGNNGNVGIGTSAPTAKLHVGSTTETNPLMRIYSANNNNQLLTYNGSGALTSNLWVDGSGNGQWYQYANGSLTNVLTTNGASYIMGGNVGIGTTNPSGALLEVSKSQNGDTITMVANANTGSGAAAKFRLSADGSTGDIFQNSSTNTNYGGANSLNILQAGNNPIALGTSGSTRMYIKGDGNIGVGTTTPLAKFEVNSTLGTAPAASVSARTNAFAAMVINNDGLGSLLTASSSGLTRFEVTNLGDVIAKGQLQMGNFTTAQAATLTPVGRGALYYNTDEDTLFISNDGTTWSSLSGQDTVPLTNNSGGSVSQYSIVIQDTTQDSSFTTTTTPYNARVIGIMSSSSCAAAATCLVTVSGKTKVRVDNTVSRGDYLYTSTTAGRAIGTGAQHDGMLGVAQTAGTAGNLVDVILIPQLANLATAAIDKGSKHNEYWLLANDYNETNTGTNPNTNIPPRELFFDNFIDNSKVGSNSAIGGPWQQSAPKTNTSTAPNTPAAPFRAGMTNGQTYSTSTSDNNGLTYLGSNTVNDISYYDRTRDSSPAVLVNLGIDPNWYNGVTLSVASTSGTIATASATFSQNDTNPNQQVNPSLSTSYNGSVVRVSGQMSTSVSNPAKTINIMVKSTTASTITYDWSDGSVGKVNNTATFAQLTELQTQGGTSTGVFVRFMKAKYNTGDVFRIASWYIENTTSNNFRGAKAQFPERSYIVASGSTTGYLDIIDADTQKLWMRFQGGGSAATNYNYIGGTSNPLTFTSMLNGALYTGGQGGGGMYRIYFSADSANNVTSSGFYSLIGAIAERNSGKGISTAINTTYTLPTSTASDVAVAVIPNQPKGQVTVSGWGYINVNLPGGGQATETVNLPYKFITPPNVTLSYAGYAGAGVTKLTDCTTDNVAGDYKPVGIATYAFTASFTASAAWIANTCYTWTATGTVAPQQYVAVATGTRTAAGGIAIINETEQTSVSGTRNTVASLHVAIANGDLYYSYVGTGGENTIGVKRNIPTILSAWDLYSSADEFFDRSNSATAIPSTMVSGPKILGPLTQQVTSLAVTPGTSTIDGKSNTIYVGTANGLAVIQEKTSGGTTGDDQVQAEGSVKNYTKEYITEEMVGDARLMMPFNGTAALSTNTTMTPGSGDGDASIKANNITTKATAPTRVTGVRGKALSFSGGANDYLCSGTSGTCADDDDLDIGTGTFSLGAWVKTTSTGEILTKGGASPGSNYSYQLAVGLVTTNKADFILNTTTGIYANVASATSVNDGKWHHIVGTWNPTGTTLRIYVDGKLEGSTTTTSGTLNTNTASDFEIGRRGDGVGIYTGIIDEPFVTATLLDGQKIKEMYTVGYRALQSHSTALGGSSADGNQQLSATVTMIADAQVDFNNQYMYASTSNIAGGSSALSTIDLNSDTNIKTYTSSGNTPSGGTIPNNTTKLAVSYNLEAVSASTAGVMTMAPDNFWNGLSGEYVSAAFEAQESFSQAYVWVSAVLDSQDASNTMAIYVSNDGGYNFNQCNLSNTDSNQSPPEYEYFCQMNTPGTTLVFKAVMNRGSTKTNTYITRYGVGWISNSAQAQSVPGNGFYTNTNASVGNGSYIELTHNQGTYDLITNGWVYDNGVWKQLDGGYTAAYSWDGKDTIRNQYHEQLNLYTPTSETNQYNQDLINNGLMFDTFEDGTKYDASASANAIMQQYKQDNNGLPAQVGVGQLNRIQKGRTGLTGGMQYTTSTVDSDSKGYLESATVNKIFYYDRPNRDSSPATMVSLGIDPNWYNGVTLAVATTSASISQNDTNYNAQVNPNLSTNYNGSLMQVQGNYSASTSARTIFVTINSASGSASTTPLQGTTFNWTDANGNSGTNVVMTPGQWQALSPTGVQVKFTGGVTYNPGDVFRIASWYVEPASLTRGSKRSFPERSYIIAGGATSVSGTVDIIDADTQKVWMKFTSFLSGLYPMLGTRIPMTSANMLNGHLYLTQGSTGGLRMIPFDQDTAYYVDSANNYKWNKGGIANRNVTGTFAQNWGSTAYSNFFISDASANDVSAAVVPNQPTGQVTISGWGYVTGTSTVGPITESVNFPYKFTNAPIVVISNGQGTPTTAPKSLADCNVGNSLNHTSANTITTSNFNVAAYYGGSNMNGLYFCYTWTATGTVAPKQMVAVATGTNTTTGGVTEINETDGTDVDITVGSTYGSKVALTSQGSLYYNRVNNTNGSNTIMVFNYLPSANISTNTDYNYFYNNTSIPGLLSLTNPVSSLAVTEGTSTIDGKSNTIYVGQTTSNNTTGGVNVIQEYQSRANMNDLTTEQFGSVKFYTKDYVTEEMVGDIRNMSPMNGSGTPAINTTISGFDASTNANAWTTKGSGTVPVYATGVRGTGMTFDGSDYLCTGTTGTCADDASLDTTSSSLSVGAWIKRSASGTTIDTIMAKYGNAAADQAFDLYIDSSNRPVFYTVSGATPIAITASTTITDTNWHYLTGIFDNSGDTMYLYMDGVLLGTAARTGDLNNSGVAATIGSDLSAASNTPANFFRGTIDDPFVTAYAIPAQKLKEMYNVGYRALQNHNPGLGGSSLDSNQQLAGTTNAVADAKPDYNNQFMYVSTSDTNNGRVSKIALNSDTNVKTIDDTTNIPAGGTLSVNNTNSSLAVGYDLEAVSASTAGVMAFSPTNAAYTTSGSFYSKAVALPQTIASAVVWVRGWLDSSDSSSTLTVAATANAGNNPSATTYDTCTLVSTDNSGPLPEKEYACDLSTSGSNLQMKFTFNRQSVTGGYNANNYITEYGVSWLGASGFKIEQTSNNTLRLYNYSGITQNLRLDAITGMNTQNNGYVSLAPAAADVDTQNFSNSIWINKTGLGGTLLKLQQNGTDVFTITPSYVGNPATATLSANFNPGTDNTYSLGSSPSARWKDLYLGPSSLHIVCKQGEGAGCNNQTVDWSMGINTTTGNFQIMPNGTATNNTAKLTFATNGNVGIGTTAPGNLFTVNQSANTTPATFGTYGMALYNQGTQNFTIGSDASYAYLQSWASKPLQINNLGNNIILNGAGSGNVGIGITNPGAVLTVNNTGNSTSGFRVLASDGDWATIYSGTSTDAYFQNAAGYVYLNSSGYFNTSSAIGCIQGYCPTNQAIRMTPNLHLNSYQGYGVYINWDNSSGSTPLVVGNGAGTSMMQVNTSGQLHTYQVIWPGCVSGCTGMQSSWYLAGHASYGLYSNATFRSEGSIYGATFIDINNGSTVLDPNGTSTLYRVDTTLFRSVTSIIGPAPCIDGSQFMGPCASDRRLKENIRYFEDSNMSALDIVGQLKPALFDVIKDGSKDHPGFIAQDIQLVLPHTLTINPDGMFSFSQDQLIPYIVKATQELNQKVDLNNQVQTLSVATTSAQIAQTHSELDNLYATVNALEGTQSAQLATLTESINNLALSSTDFVTISPNATPSATKPFMAIDSFGKVYNNAAAYAQAAIANAKIGALDVKTMTINGQTLQDYIIAIVTNAGFTNNTNIVAPIASIDRVYTNALSPLPNSGGAITIEGNLAVTGNATISGTLAAKDASISGNLAANAASISGTLTATKLEGEDGVFNGTLRAKNIVADNIVGLQATIATMAAKTITNITNVYQTPATSIYKDDDASHSALLAALGTLPTGVNMASFSGSLANVDTVVADFGTFNQGLLALGPSSFTDVAVSGQFSVGSLYFAENSINTLGADLEIQPLAQGGLRIMNGKISVNTNGDVQFGESVTFAKNVQINGRLISKVISPIPDEDLVIELGVDGLGDSKFLVKNATGSAVLAVNQKGDLTASGSGTFKKLNFSLIKPAIATGAGDLISFEAVGVATISAARTEITIHNSMVTDKSLIYLTPVGQTAQPVHLMRQKAGESFTVGGTAGAVFNWLIIN